MLTSLNPVGEAARGQRWWLTTTAYLVASTVGGGLVGAAAGLLGAPLVPRVPATIVAATLAAVAAAGVVLDTSGRRVPSWRRQVDERWLTTYRGWVYGAGFGLQLGAGVVTIVPSTLTYVVLAAAVLTGDAGAGAAIGAAFGVTRALPVLAAGRARTPEALRSLHRRTVARGARVARATVAAQAVAAGLLAGVVVAGLVAGGSA